MKVADIISRVRSIAGDTAVLQFTNQDVINWINDGVRECAIANNLLQKTATSTSVIGINEYTLPPDILKLHSVSFDGTKVRMLTLEEYQQLVDSDDDSSGLSQFAYIWGSKLYMYPTPDRAVELRINYLYTPELLTLSGETIPDVEPSLPVGYHSRLVDYCLAQVAQQDDDLNRYQVKMQEFYTGVSNLKNNHEHEEDLYPSISVSPRDWGNEYYG